METIQELEQRIQWLNEQAASEPNEANRTMLEEEIQERIDDIQMEYAKQDVDRLDMNCTR